MYQETTMVVLGQRESFGSRERSQSSYSSRDAGPRPKGAYGASSTSREAYGSSSAYSGPVARRGTGSPSRGFAYEARPTSTRRADNYGEGPSNAAVRYRSRSPISHRARSPRSDFVSSSYP